MLKTQESQNELKYGGHELETKERIFSDVLPLEFQATVFILLYLHEASHIILFLGFVLPTASAGISETTV